MTRHENPWVSELLSWHGHDRGGVRVPFHATMGKPLGDVVETSVIMKIKRLASDLVKGAPGTPRWVFLIGGPGNGKSEAVETFVQELDIQTNSQGAFVNLVAKKFEPDPVAPRRVNVTAEELQGSVLQERLRSLIIVQDASAVEGAGQVAEDTLLEDLAELVTCPSGQEPVFICCANRGLVARARSGIHTSNSPIWLDLPEVTCEVTKLLTRLLTATGLGPDALTADRPNCWPLDFDKRFAAWPLDLESIIRASTGSSPFEQMVITATDGRKWEGKNGCHDCSARVLCPFYANAKMLRDDAPRRKLIELLRHSELATGQRWNFRDSFSLCAELIVGQRDDFSSCDQTDTPCSWVQERVDEVLLGGQPARSLSAAWELALHLYSQALFPVWQDPTEELHAKTVKRSVLTNSVVLSFGQPQRSRGAHIRNLLAGVFSQKLDPALATPPVSDSVLREVEDEFAQSVRQGSDTFNSRLNPLIDRLLGLMAVAEAEWSETVRESNRVRAILESLRILCSILVKRFLGVREGEYLNTNYLVEYETSLRDPQKLREVFQPLREILAPGGIFYGSLIRVFGQPPPDATRDILVSRPLGNVFPVVDSESTDKRPGHDIPWAEVERHRIPLTFDLFVALQSFSNGAQLASFAPHTRAAIDKVKNAIAGELVRDKRGMQGGGVSIKVGALGCLTPAADETLEFVGSKERP